MALSASELVSHSVVFAADAAIWLFTLRSDATVRDDYALTTNDDVSKANLKRVLNIASESAHR